MFRFHSRGLFNGCRKRFFFVQQVTGINYDYLGLFFTVLIEISSLFVQPAELFAGFRSTARLGIAQHVTAVDYREF